jgi:hypothetical protein
MVLLALSLSPLLSLAVPPNLVKSPSSLHTSTRHPLTFPETNSVSRPRLFTYGLFTPMLIFLIFTAASADHRFPALI